MVDPEQRFWPARVRWRLRGAWMWPTFVAITLLDGLLLHVLPPVRTGIDLIPAVLLATFGNLVLIGAIGPWLARRVWKRRPAAEPDAPPKAQLEVLSDRIGTGLLVASVFGVLAAGLAARPTVIAETDAKAGPRGAIHASCRPAAIRELRPQRGDGAPPGWPTASSGSASPATTASASPASSSTRPAPTDQGSARPEREAERDRP